MSSRFRFEDLQIWQIGAELSVALFKLADELEEKKLFRFAEQLRGAVLSITNNIAEGSGSTSDKEFQQFLNFSRRSIFETANILFMMVRAGVLKEEEIQGFINRLEEQSRKVLSFSRSLNT
ncbi:MAG: four helix bundle protein [Blastochloris sp.]|nr:four helix bundle protein [Blastochloris sp.]